MGLVNFFKKVGHDIKVALEKVGHAFASVFITLFGLKAAQDFAAAAEALLQTDFGKVLLDASEALIASLAAGSPLKSIIAAVGELVISEAEKAGITIAEDLAQLLASLVVNKLNGNLAAVAAVKKLPPA